MRCWSDVFHNLLAASQAIAPFIAEGMIMKMIDDGNVDDDDLA